METEAIKTLPIAPYAIKELGYKPVAEKDSARWRVLASPNGRKVLALFS